MKLPRIHPKYKDGVNEFLNLAFTRAAVDGCINCPCKKCVFRDLHNWENVHSHLICHGFVEGYTLWNFHGEGLPSMEIEQSMDCDSNDEGLNDIDDIDMLLNDTFGNLGEGEEQNAGANNFFKLMEEGKKELYPGCKNFSKLSFTIRLYLFKCINRVSNVAFSDLLELLQEVMPEANLPKSYYEAKKTINSLGLGYKKIHACPKDCILYRKEYENAESCHVCGTSRWKEYDQKEINEGNRSKIPAKVLRHFPLQPRLQRILMCSETAEEMTWHERKRKNDGNLRHPADGQCWKDFDSMFADFAKDPRNVRLGLASDGFSPFGTMSVSHSTWPVVLINYNLPPWMCLKPEYLILSLLIPGPNYPGMDIDVYLQPLIDELKELWQYGVETYDAFSKRYFNMRAALLWTVNDFPAYAMLSGWSTQGRLACPCCHYDTCSQYYYVPNNI
ncbi:unnamed protein product [Cuscuta europaea]|uniref:Transposase-associated domain-containing protein n=1 Tax=Cuscuta europaea TaxID=41803 RepID=A0A9P0YTQ4_CUSEU|nr:unnamed protein product [Cuscuta europaea]